jgi:hypothetical protein
MFIGWIDAVSFYEFYELQFFVPCVLWDSIDCNAYQGTKDLFCFAIRR